MAGHDQKAMAWGSFRTKRRACLQMSWINPKNYLVRKLCFAAFFSPLHHFTLMSYPSSGLASALGPPSMKVPILLLECSRFSWVSAKTQRGNADGLAYEKLALVEKTGAPHWKNQTAQFLSKSTICTPLSLLWLTAMCYLSGSLDTYPRKHLIKPLPLSFTPTGLTHIVLQQEECFTLLPSLLKVSAGWSGAGLAGLGCTLKFPGKFSCFTARFFFFFK